jgi:hypothetical protein
VIYDGLWIFNENMLKSYNWEDFWINLLIMQENELEKVMQHIFYLLAHHPILDDYKNLTHNI